MPEILLWLILFGTILAAGLSMASLIRSPRAFLDAGKHLQDNLRMGREETLNEARGLREEVAGGLKSANETLSRTLENMGKLQQNQLTDMTRQLKELADSNQGGLDRIRATFDTRIKELQESNEKKLDAMRKTVDEQLQTTLEKRLGESFKIVSERLEAVHKGLGEMQNLATGVGDLKRVLTNVSTRGTWAEVQLGAILEQVLAPTQFAKNVRVKADSLERVEYAVRLPGAKDDPDSCVWLPIDAKFPREDFLRLQEAVEKADTDAVQSAANALAQTFRGAARDIHDKYIHPPDTTDFGIMFLATEGLYAEALRHPNLAEELQQRYRVMIAGPTTLAATLSSLRMGFQTLAIKQRATQVWNVLGAVKTEFKKFGETLDRVKSQLNAATRTIEQTGVRSRAMERSLRNVAQMPDAQAAAILALSETDKSADATFETVDETSADE